MLSADVERYVTLRSSLGHRLVEVRRMLRSYARFAEDAGDTHVRAARALEWANTGSTPLARGIRLRAVTRFAAFLRAEDPVHELPATGIFPTKMRRQVPYIYDPGEIVRLLEAATRLHRTYPSGEKPTPRSLASSPAPAFAFLKRSI
jgi:integrase/recombinase XerD